MAEAAQKTEGRKGDGVLIVAQDNDAKALTILSANESAANLLGYATQALTETPFANLLGAKTLELVSEELDYQEDGRDLEEIFSRQRTIRLRTRLGEEMNAQVAISRLMAEGRQSRFQLVLPDEREKLEQQKLRDFLKTNLEGRQQLDESLGLPDRNTAEAYLGLLKNYIAESRQEVAFAVLRIDRHEKNMARYGKQGCRELLQHLANGCRATFRTEDVLFVLSDHMLGLILFDISRESARMVFTRLRWNVRSHRIVFGGKSDFANSVSISFDMLDADRGEGLLARCEEAMEKFSKEERNALVELGNA